MDTVAADKENILPSTGGKGRRELSAPAENENLRCVAVDRHAVEALPIHRADVARSHIVSRIVADPTNLDMWLALIDYDKTHAVFSQHIMDVYHESVRFLVRLEDKNLVELVTVWLDYIDLLRGRSADDARDVFRLMRAERIGCNDCRFYLAWARLELLLDNPEKATALLANASSRGLLPDAADHPTVLRLLSRCSLPSSQMQMGSLRAEEETLVTVNRQQADTRLRTPGHVTALDQDTVVKKKITFSAAPPAVSQFTVDTVHGALAMTPGGGGRGGAATTTPLPSDSVTSSRRMEGLASSVRRGLPGIRRLGLSIAGGPSRRSDSTDIIPEREEDTTSTVTVSCPQAANPSSVPIFLDPPSVTVISSAGDSHIDSPASRLLAVSSSSSVFETASCSSVPRSGSSGNSMFDVVDSSAGSDETDVKIQASRLRLDGSQTALSSASSSILSSSGGRSVSSSALSSASSSSSLSASASVYVRRSEEPKPRPALSLARTGSSLQQEPQPAQDSCVARSTSSAGAVREIEVVNGVSYAVLGMIGRGGSCRVYKVLSEAGDIFAMKKVSLEGLDSSTVDLFVNEVSLLRRFKGKDHIVQLVDSELDPGRKTLYVVMELGQTDLSQLLQRTTALSGSHRVDSNACRLYWHQMLTAVQVVHEERIVHADLKPSNFLVVEGRLKLIDFGIAKAIQNDTTNIHRDSQVGTVNYMSPEAIGKNKQGRPSDVWSLGCILYQIVHGKPPFADLSLIQKLHAITDTKYEIVFPPIKDNFLADVMKHCLQRDPAARPSIPELLGHPYLNVEMQHDILRKSDGKVPADYASFIAHQICGVLFPSPLPPEMESKRVGVHQQLTLCICSGRQFDLRLILEEDRPRECAGSSLQLQDIISKKLSLKRVGAASGLRDRSAAAVSDGPPSLDSALRERLRTIRRAVSAREDDLTAELSPPERR